MGKCKCSVKGQCRGCHETDLYNAGMRAGYLKRQTELKEPFEKIEKTISEITALLEGK